MSFSGLRAVIVGPLPPPAGGMANQTSQLAELLRQEGASVDERFYWVAYGNAHGANGPGSLRYARVMAQTRGAH